MAIKEHWFWKKSSPWMETGELPLKTIQPVKKSMFGLLGFGHAEAKSTWRKARQIL